jgi:hypothetical protein
MRKRTFCTGALVLIMTSSLLPSLIVAQTTIKASAPTTRAALADEIQQRAAALHDQPRRYSEAAWLYRESAALRAATDPRAIESLATAAHLYHYANRLFDARKTMEQAARQALARGDVVRASVANLEAAFFAYKQGNQAQANRLGRAALRLADSPMLTPEQRALIVNRLRSSPAVAALVE